MWSRLLLACLLAAPAGAGHAAAEDLNPLAGLLTCAPARDDVASVQIEDVRFGATETYYWASGTVRLHLRDRSEQAYAVSGRAVPLNLPLASNDVRASFAYPGFRCIVQYPFITAVRNCHRRGPSTACDVALRFWGKYYSYTVSMTANAAPPPKASSAQSTVQ